MEVGVGISNLLLVYNRLYIYTIILTELSLPPTLQCLCYSIRILVSLLWYKHPSVGGMIKDGADGESTGTCWFPNDSIGQAQYFLVLPPSALKS